MKILRTLLFLSLSFLSLASFAESEKKGFLIKEKLRVDLGFGLGLNSSFQNITFYQMGLAFQWRPNWSLEYRFDNYSISDSDEVDNLNIIGGVPLLEKLRRSHGLFFVYSPISGELDAWGKKASFKVYGALGPVYLDLEDNLNSFNGIAFQDSFRSLKKWGGAWRLGSRAWLNKSFSCYFELMGIHHISKELEGVKKKELLTRFYVQFGGSIHF